MAFDLIVKNGMIVDGSGLPRFRGDVGVKDGKIAEIGRLDGVAAKETLDAEGHVVSPGFVDGHTHMDAQIFWDPIGTSSCYQGVTSVVMGNCGFTLAPCREAEADLVFVGSWTDGLFLFGQRPGRVGRFKKLPWLDDKHVSVFCTYAHNPGGTIAGLSKVLERKGAVVVGGQAIKRSQIDAEHVGPFVADQFEAFAAKVG